MYESSAINPFARIIVVASIEARYTYAVAMESPPPEHVRNDTVRHIETLRPYHPTNSNCAGCPIFLRFHSTTSYPNAIFALSTDCNHTSVSIMRTGSFAPLARKCFRPIMVYLTTRRQATRKIRILKQIRRRGPHLHAGLFVEPIGVLNFSGQVRTSPARPCDP